MIFFLLFDARILKKRKFYHQKSGFCCLLMREQRQLAYEVISGYGGTGRRARFRFWWETVQVRFLLSALNKRDGIKSRLFYYAQTLRPCADSVYASLRSAQI